MGGERVPPEGKANGPRREDETMEEKRIYTECELRYMDQGYDLERAVETCAQAEGRPSGEEKKESNENEPWKDSWGDF